MKKSMLVLAIAAQGLFPIQSRADDETDIAISEVQEMMKSPDFAQKASGNSPEAPQAAAFTKQISGNAQNEQEIYKLAAEVLGNMKGMSTEQMMELLEKAKSDPEAFARTWSPEQQRKLQELSERLPASKQKKP